MSRFPDAFRSGNLIEAGVEGLPVRAGQPPLANILREIWRTRARPRGPVRNGPFFRPVMFRDRSGPYRSNPPEGRAISGMGKCRPGGIHSFPKPSSDEGNVRAKGDGRFRNQKERSPFERRAPFSFPVAPVNVYSAIFSKFPFLSILKVVAGRSSSSNRTSFLARFMIFMIVS